MWDLAKPTLSLERHNHHNPAAALIRQHLQSAYNEALNVTASGADREDGAAIARHIANQAARCATGVIVESPEDIDATLDAWDERPA
jgi:hypothetical protein